MAKNKDKEYRKLGQTVRQILGDDYLHTKPSWKRFVWLNFLRGVIAGVGGVLGATILIGLLIWILSLLDTVPWIGDLFKSLRETIQQ